VSTSRVRELMSHVLSTVFCEPFGSMRTASNVMKLELSLIGDVAALIRVVSDWGSCFLTLRAVQDGLTS
jgi:hypothetical protein